VFALQTIVSFVIVLSILVFVHELGHFLFAKRAGILVREFAIGFGPLVFSKRKGETLYSLRLLPLGGFVRMAGEDPEIIDIKPDTTLYLTQSGQLITDISLVEPRQKKGGQIIGTLVEMDTERDLFIRIRLADGTVERYPLHQKAFIHFGEKEQSMQIAPLDRQFGSKKVWPKFLTIVAGPVFNIVFTILLFSLYTGMTGVNDKLPVYSVAKDSPAAIAGILPGDVIKKVNGQQVTTIDMLRAELVNSKGQTVPITVQRGNETKTYYVTPQKQGQGFIIGATFDERQMKRTATVGEIVREGFTQTYDWSILILDGFRGLVTGQISFDSLGGPTQMGYMTGKAAEAGFATLIKWMALLSLNLGIFNLLPIPALDGSRLLFILLEGLRGRPINPNRESLIHFVGFGLLMLLMVFVTYNDIVKIFFT
jgi:regulator of sigma E protease